MQSSLDTRTDDCQAEVRQGCPLTPVQAPDGSAVVTRMEQMLPPMQLREGFTYEEHHKPFHDALGHGIVELSYKRQAEVGMTPSLPIMRGKPCACG